MGSNWRLINSDVIAGLRRLPEASVHCVVTSPPYWGLRDYGTPAQVWGGDPECAHEWSDAMRTPWANSLPGPNGRSKNGTASRQRPKETGPFCQKCDAWRGSLGLEPAPELFVRNLVLVFREVWRVLRPEGALFLNLGDSYYGSWQNYGGGARGAGKQRPLLKGSQAQNPAWEGREGYRPAATYPHSTLKPKDLVGMPWRVALALQADGWWLRSDIIWVKPNPLPESVSDRPTKSHEYLFLLTKSARYFYDQEAVREPLAESAMRQTRATHRQAGGSKGIAIDRSAPRSLRDLKEKYAAQIIWSGRHRGWAERDKSIGRNLRTVWHIATEPNPDAHFAAFPQRLVEPCIKAGASEYGCCAVCGAPWARSKTNQAPSGWEPSCKCEAPGDPVACVVLDPFAGTSTTGVVALRLGRRFIGIELNPEYCQISERRLREAERRAYGELFLNEETR